MMRKRILVLGSTGSIGKSALDVAAAMSEDVCVVGLAARTNWKCLADQAAEFHVPTVAIADERHYDDLRRACPAGTTVYAGADGLVELVTRSDANFVLAAIVGAAACRRRSLPSSAASMSAWPTRNRWSSPARSSCRSQSATAGVDSVDSEHSAIFQAMQPAGRKRCEKST